MPNPDQIGKAYRSYYTHSDSGPGERGNFLKELYRSMKLGYWGLRFGYRAPWQSRVLGGLLYLFPLRRNEADSEARCLNAVLSGRLLDVGCGSGAWLKRMHEMGWQVQGVDFDPGAVNIARSYGLDVGCGALEDQGYPGESFDAVTLNHVIEHVPDPIATLRECLRVLKPGGRLVLATPNTESLSHRIFKTDWRGLEPPRHLHIFCSNALKLALISAGFDEVVFRPQIASSVIYESILLRRGRAGFSAGLPRDFSTAFVARCFCLLELCLVRWRTSVADCLIAIAIKR